MNALGDLLRARRDNLKSRGVHVVSIIAATGLADSTVYEYLTKTVPFKTSPRRKTLEQLAKGFQLPVEEVLAAAKEATGAISGDPLQLLVRSAQIESGLSARQASRRAKKAGHPISEGSISEILSGAAANPSDGLLTGLAAGFGLDPEQVKAAARQSRAQLTYRLPSHIEARLTPERWAKVLKIIDDVLNVGE